MPHRLRSTIRDTKRLAEMLSILARHGFSAVVQETGIDGVFARGMNLLTGGDGGPGVAALSQDVRIRMMLEELGPSFIKMGQILSTRPDLIPPGLVEELEKLQDDVPTVAFEEIRRQLDAEFDGKVDEVFRSVDETPLGSGSMAQVHPAVLADGTPVVLKVLRPGIEAIVESDTTILLEIAKFTKAHFEDRGFNPVQVVEEFSRQIRKEVNLSIEATSTERLRRHFEDNPKVNFPKVFKDASTRRVLTLERVVGSPLSRIEREDVSPEVRRAIVTHGTDAVFDMCLDYGFFHADPHPGNIFYFDDGSITLIDCGMTGHVESDTSVLLAQLVQAVVAGDARRVVHVALNLSGGDPLLEFDRKFRADVGEYISGLSLAGGSLEDLELGPMLHGFFDLLRTWRIVCPSDLVFLIKALATIEGVGRTIDPTFRLVSHVRPKLEQLVRRHFGPRAVSRRVTQSLGAYVDIIEELPTELRALISQARRNGFAIDLKHQGLERLTYTMDRGSKTVAYGVVVAAVIVAFGLLANRGGAATGMLTAIGFIALGATLVVVLGLAFINIRKWPSKKDDR